MQIKTATMHKEINNKINNKVVSEVLRDVATSFIEDKISIREIKDAIRERGFAILLLIFALPLTIPLPVPPGATTIASMPILLFSLQMVIGLASPWLPQWLEKKSIKRTTLAIIAEKTSAPLKKIEKITCARLSIVVSILGTKVFAVCSLICSVSIFIPLPMTNFIPAISIVLMSFGVLNRDGLMILVGIIIGAIGIAITFLVVVFGPKVIISMFKHIM